MAAELAHADFLPRSTAQLPGSPEATLDQHARRKSISRTYVRLASGRDVSGHRWYR